MKPLYGQVRRRNDDKRHFPTQDSDILKASDFFKSLIQRKAADVTQTDI
jgi:hypothetical protein